MGKSVGIQQGFYKRRYSESCGFHGDFITNSEWIPKGIYKDSMLIRGDSLKNTEGILLGFYREFHGMLQGVMKD